MSIRLDEQRINALLKGSLGTVLEEPRMGYVYVADDGTTPAETSHGVGWCSVRINDNAEYTAVKIAPGIRAFLRDGLAVRLERERDGTLYIASIDRVVGFEQLGGTDPAQTIGVHDHQDSLNGGVLDAAAIGTGELLLERGGTEADLSATGGANQFLKQSSAGAVVTVGTIGASDITTALTTPPAIGGTTPAAGAFTTLGTSGAVVHNEAGADVDFRIEGDTDANLVTVDAGLDAVGIGTVPNAAAKLHIVSTTKGSIPYPVMTTAQRTAIGTPVVGLGAYDSDLDALYLYDGAGWVEIGAGGGASAFTDLTDVPAAYTGDAGKVVAVNGTEDGLEFVTVGGGTPLSVTTTDLWLGEVIQDVTLGSAGRFDYSSIPTGYKMLKFIFRVRSSVTATSDATRFFINGETSANDAKYHFQVTTGGNASGDFSEGANSNIAAVSAASSVANSFTYIYVYIVDYDSTSYRKFLRIENHSEFAADNVYVSKRTMVWEDTAAINQIQFQPDGYSTDNFAIGSQMTVIGYKERALVTAVTGGSGVLAMDTSNVSNPPTDAELDSAFGTPATVGAGFHAAVNDNGAGTNVYLVLSDGSNWWFTAMTKAT